MTCLRVQRLYHIDRLICQILCQWRIYCGCVGGTQIHLEFDKQSIHIEVKKKAVHGRLWRANVNTLMQTAELTFALNFINLLSSQN